MKFWWIFKVSIIFLLYISRILKPNHNARKKQPTLQNTNARPAFPAISPRIFRLITRERIGFYIRLLDFLHSLSSKGHVLRASLSVRSSDYDLWRTWDTLSRAWRPWSSVHGLVWKSRAIIVLSCLTLPGWCWDMCEDGGFCFVAVWWVCFFVEKFNG